jgi:hypothetical protein
MTTASNPAAPSYAFTWLVTILYVVVTAVIVGVPFIAIAAVAVL